MSKKKSTVKTIKTTWEARTFDVWGNAKEGYWVNDTLSKWTVTLDLEVQTANAGTPNEFNYAAPSNKQIRQVLGLGRTQFSASGDDISISIDRDRDGYPLGSLFCLSHKALSPIKEKPE